jgi:hypothetical protein
MDEATKQERDREAKFYFVRLVLVFLAAWVLMLTEARIDKDTGVPGGNLSYLASVGIVGTIWLVAVAKRPFSGLVS